MSIFLATIKFMEIILHHQLRNGLYEKNLIATLLFRHYLRSASINFSKIAETVFAGILGVALFAYPFHSWMRI